MPQIINTNISSLNSQRHLNNTQSALSRSLERLSSGKRINSAKDDAAGLGISERMSAQVNGMNQAIRNARDGISMSQTAEGALATSGDMLQRIRTLAVQSSNATNSSADRQALQDEVNELSAELNRIATTTKFNGQNLLDGTLGAQNYQVGANAGELISTTGTNFQTAVYGNNRTYTVSQVTADNTTTLSFAADDIVVSGRSGSTSALKLQSQATTAKQAAAMINAETYKSGVTASAKTEAVLTATVSESYSIALSSNNAQTDAVTVSFTIGTTLDADGYASAVNAINAASAKTGVVAEYSKELEGIKLTNAAGENIRIGEITAVGDLEMDVVQYDASTDAQSLSGSAATIAAGSGSVTGNVAEAMGVVTLDSQSSFGVSGTVTDFDEAASQLKAVATLDVTTFDKAQMAIAIADAAINTINAERARYGALQSRFESTITNLEVNSENTSNARSRIKDADYAAETAELSRASILQQAGTAMLAQANQMPQSVLSLIG